MTNRWEEVRTIDGEKLEGVGVSGRFNTLMEDAMEFAYRRGVTDALDSLEYGDCANKFHNPEKLNNAHDYAAAMADWLMSHYRGKMDAEMADELESEITKLCVLFENRVALAEFSLSSPPPVPVQMRCPVCLEIHIDEGEWATRPHKTHLCQRCGHEWRPFPYATVGVAASTELLPTQLEPDKLCDFCHKPRDESHDLLACSDVVNGIADMNNLRKAERNE